MAHCTALISLFVDIFSSSASSVGLFWQSEVRHSCQDGPKKRQGGTHVTASHGTQGETY